MITKNKLNSIYNLVADDPKLMNRFLNKPESLKDKIKLTESEINDIKNLLKTKISGKELISYGLKTDLIKLPIPWPWYPVFMKNVKTKNNSRIPVKQSVRK